MTGRIFYTLFVSTRVMWCRAKTILRRAAGRIIVVPPMGRGGSLRCVERRAASKFGSALVAPDHTYEGDGL